MQWGTLHPSAYCVAAKSPRDRTTGWLCGCVNVHLRLCHWTHPGNVALIASAPGTRAGRGKLPTWHSGIAMQGERIYAWQQRWGQVQRRTTVDSLVRVCLQDSVLKNLEGNTVSMSINVCISICHVFVVTEINTMIALKRHLICKYQCWLYIHQK